ncbi:MAG: polyprenyl synthetase family protein [Lachnospiraceae bacterium]|nr:polyprenyl synthetase family protein [Lachnospiraceae bacterium]
MDFKENMNAKVLEVNDIIEKYLPKIEGYQKTVIDAMHYSTMSNGKRVRAILMLETYRLFGGDSKVVEPFIAAIEMIHAYSLVHDDLPALDNDEYRRGKKSTHAEYGEAMGILCGDALLNYAFETVTKAFDIECSPRVAYAYKILATKAGINGMIGGQVVDVESEGNEIDADTMLYIHKNKTAALIEAAMMVGAILASANVKEIAKIESLASDVGLAFQIQDDILDIISSSEVLGKPVGSDDKNNKNTYVKYNGLDKSKEEVKTLSNRAVSTLDSLDDSNEFLNELIKSMINREK